MPKTVHGIMQITIPNSTGRMTQPAVPKCLMSPERRSGISIKCNDDLDTTDSTSPTSKNKSAVDMSSDLCSPRAGRTGSRAATKNILSLTKTACKDNQIESNGWQDSSAMSRTLGSKDTGVGGDSARRASGAAGSAKCASGAGRKLSVDEEDVPDVNAELQQMLEQYGSGMKKSLSAKRQKLERLTSQSTKTTTKSIEDVATSQQQQRQKMLEEFRKQVSSVLDQWSTDIEKSKEHEERLNALVRQQGKCLESQRKTQTQRLNTLKDLHEQFSKGAEEMDNAHREQHAGIQQELKKEMILLQKRILMDTQQQEMINVRKSLHSMLSTN